MTSDAVTTLGSGVDGAVRRLEIGYDTQGNAYKLTSYDAASGGNVVNEIQREFNGLGQMTKEWQEHSGAVNTSTSLKVQYAYSEMSGGANHSRLTSMTYPDGKVLTFNYSSGLNSDISRLSSLSDSTGALESYDYLGFGIIVKRGHTQPGVDQTLIKQSGESNGDAGDQYIGLDRFYRLVDQRWRASASDKDRFQYGYDRDGNRLYRDNTLDNNFDELYHTNGASNGYDLLNQLTDFRRGALSDANSDGVPDTVTTASRTQTWDFDALGNFDGQNTDCTNVTRGHNKQNEITSIGSGSTPTYDANGNMTGDETGRLLEYDAWNRVVRIKNSGGTTLVSYKYDAINRRVSDTKSGTTTDFYYSDQWQVLEERVSGAAKIQYVWSPVYVDAMILRDRDVTGDSALEERLWVMHDANFNVTGLLDTSGNVVERFAYDPYGVATYFDASWSTRGSSIYAWIYLHQGGRWESVAGLYHFRNRDLSPTLARWLQMDPMGLRPDLNYYRNSSSSPASHLDPFGLDVTVLWIEGATLPLQAKGGLEVHVVAPLKAIFVNQETVKWVGFQAGTGILMGQNARKVAETAKKCKDKTVLIGYSWGAYTAVQAMSMAYFNIANFPEQHAPTFKINLVYTIDPVIGTPELNYDSKPYSNSKTKDGTPTILGSFDEWHSWFQQVDNKGTIPGLRMLGRSLNDPRIKNKEYVARDFATPNAAHKEIVEKKEIRDTIEKGIRKLL